MGDSNNNNTTASDEKSKRRRKRISIDFSNHGTSFFSNSARRLGGSVSKKDSDQGAVEPTIPPPATDNHSNRLRLFKKNSSTKSNVSEIPSNTIPEVEPAIPAEQSDEEKKPMKKKGNIISLSLCTYY